MNSQKLRRLLASLIAMLLLIAFAPKIPSVFASDTDGINETTGSIPENPSIPLPDAVDKSIPDNAVALSKDIAVTNEGTVKNLETGKRTLDSALIGTLSNPPDPLARSDGNKFIPVSIGTIRAAINTRNRESTSSQAPSHVQQSSYRVSAANPTVSLIALSNGEYGAYWGEYHGQQAFFEKGGKLFAQRAASVVDVSQWQRKIDWARAKAHGVQGAIIRLSYGWGNGLDPYAKYNIDECKRLGIPLGVYTYSYAYNNATAGSEGNDAVSLLRKAGVSPNDLTYPVFYDLENWVWAGHSHPTRPSTYDGIVNTWFQKLMTAGYNNLSVYSYSNYLANELNSSNIHSKTRWVASYGPNSHFSYSTNFRGWQYSDSGIVEGISKESIANGVKTTSRVDFNAFGYLNTQNDIPVYRLYNRNSGLHHYTIDERERNVLVGLGWRDEGISFTTVNKSPTAKPVYREYNPHSGNHNWTLDLKEHQTLVGLGWRNENIAWNVPASAPVKVWRLYNPHSGEHVYTTNEVEYRKVGEAGWRQEGIAWNSL
ncbi:GH25 family lysozyme [Bifidobacterium mongoliense]|uniref:GH25 family lysozyme n=1 Tax=Bifidobacterium mongoliense TaxID=518643 RepID=UPI0030EE73BF